MNINCLKTNDIIILRNGNIGMYIEKDGEGYILYPSGGYDAIDGMYNVDLTDDISGEAFDVMQVYRDYHNFICFEDYADANLIFERDKAWKSPK